MSLRRLGLRQVGAASVALVLASNAALAQTAYPDTEEFPFPQPELPSQPDLGQAGPPAFLDQPETKAEANLRPWSVTPYAELDEIVTDNARLAPYRKDADLVTALTPGVKVSGRTRRLSLYVDGSATYDKYASQTDLDGWGYRVDGNALGELLDKTFFLDLRSLVTQEALDPGGFTSAVQRTLPGNQVTVFNSSASPFVRHDFGSWAATELRYRLSDLHYANASKGSVTVPGDSISQEFSGYVHSGPAFERFSWTVDGRGANTADFNDRQFRERSVIVSGTYAVIREVAVIAESGYESFADDSLGVEANSGTVWLGGLRLTPGPRTTLTALGGRRYNAPYWYAELRYRLAENLLLTASHDTSVTTQQRQFSAALNSQTRDSEGRLVDPVTGMPVDPNHLAFAFISQAYTQETNRATLTGTTGVSRLELTVEYLVRDVGALGLNQSGLYQQTAAGAYGQYTLRLSRRSDISALLGVSRTWDRDPSGENSTGYVGLSYGHDFSKGLRGTVSLRHYEVANRIDSGYRENVLFLGIRKEF